MVKDGDIQLTTTTDVQCLHCAKMDECGRANLCTIGHLENPNTRKVCERGICEPPTPTNIELLELKPRKDSVGKPRTPRHIEDFEISEGGKVLVGNRAAAHGQMPQPRESRKDSSGKRTVVYGQRCYVPQRREAGARYRTSSQDQFLDGAQMLKSVIGNHTFCGIEFTETGKVAEVRIGDMRR